MKRALPFLIVITVGLITAGAAAWLYNENKQPVLVVSEQSTREGLHVRGPKTSPVTLEEFADFQCPPCGIFAKMLKELEPEFAKDVRIVFHHFPLQGHAYARPAAMAAEAAGLQGKFWQMHDALYADQKAWAQAPDATPIFLKYAQGIGLDMEKFKRDWASPTVAERVAADQKYGESLGVKNTPTIFLNKRQVPFKDLTAAKLREEVERIEEAAERGTP